MNIIPILLEETTTTDATGFSSWLLPVVLLVFLVLMVVMTVIPQKKRQKETKKMLDSMRVGLIVKTIGGFVGKIVRLNDDGTLVINISADEGENLVLIDHLGIYNVINPSDAAVDEQNTSDNK